MYAKLPARLRACLVVCLSCTTGLFAHAAAAATLLSYDFDGPGGAFELTPQFIAGELSAAPWTDADGTLTSVSGNPGLAMRATSFHNGNAFLLALDIAPGWRLLLDGFSFDQQRSESGPPDWSLRIDGIDLASGTTGTSFAARSGVLVTAPMHGALQLAIHGAGASSTAGTLRIDNFTLSGSLTPVPLPASMLLLGTSILGLVGLRCCGSV